MTQEVVIAQPKVIDTKAAEMVTKAVAGIVLEDPFYGYLLLRQDYVQDDTIPTASTNGFRIKYNPKFIRKQTMPQLKGLMKHEVMHVAHMHHLRRQSRDSVKWNAAGDFVINALLKEAGVSLPEGGLMDDNAKDESTEHVYARLPDMPSGGSYGPNTGGFPPPWDFGGVEDAPGSADPATNTQMQEDTKVEVLQAANAAKMMGKLPAYLERLANEIRESKMPWKQILARFFRATARADYSWTKPNRRYLAHNLYLPGLHSEALGELVIGIDTSGSIGTTELAEFFGVVNGILKQTKPEKVHVIYCDAAVGNVQTFLPTDYPISLKKFKPSGGGGTAFSPVFNYVAEKKLNPCALLYLTDMYGSFPDKAPKYPTIWCSTTPNQLGPFGRTLILK